VSMAQTAASIEYEAAPTPADLPDDMQPLAGTSLRFLSIKPIDGFKVHAALWQPESKPPAETTIIVGVHGSGGNLASLPLRATARGSQLRVTRPSASTRASTTNASIPTISSKCVATSRPPSRP
jgi:hypothetical protein